MKNRNFLKEQAVAGYALDINNLMNKYNNIITAKQLAEIKIEVVEWREGTYGMYNIARFFEDNKVADTFLAKAIKKDFLTWFNKNKQGGLM